MSTRRYAGALGRRGARSLDADYHLRRAFWPGSGPPFGDNPRSSTRTAPSGSAGPPTRFGNSIRLAPSSGTGRLGTPAGSLAAGLGSIWATNGRGVLRIDPVDAESHTANPPGHAGGRADRGRSIIGVGRRSAFRDGVADPTGASRANTHHRLRAFRERASRSGTERSGWRVRSTARSFASTQRPRTYGASSSATRRSTSPLLPPGMGGGRGGWWANHRSRTDARRPGDAPGGNMRHSRPRRERGTGLPDRLGPAYAARGSRHAPDGAGDRVRPTPARFPGRPVQRGASVVRRRNRPGRVVHRRRNAQRMRSATRRPPR